MNNRSPLKRFLTNRRVWAVVILLIGVWLMVFFGTRTLRAYREFGYAREQGLLDGTATVDAIQPWMTIRYIAVAYAVPEEYIYAKLGIPFDRRAEHEPLGRLSHQRPSGPPATDAQETEPVDPQKERDDLLAEIRKIILAYRENPVAPGLRDIRPWMSIAYIANSTGVPADYILAHFQATLRAAEAGAPPPTAIQELPEDTIYKPLDILGEDLHLPGGPKALEDAINAAVDAYETEEAP